MEGDMKMRKLLAVLLSVCFCLVVAATNVGASPYGDDFDFDDIQFWVGSGSNEAAMVIDWNDGIDPVSLAWGYRWDGESAKGKDMLTAIVSADSSLYAKLGSSGSTVNGLGKDLNGGGFSIDDGTVFDSNGIAQISGNDDGAASNDPADHYKEGWFTDGFWAYFLGDSDSWVSSLEGFAVRELADGSWDGWSFAPAYSISDPSLPEAAVPIPGAAWLLGSGLVALVGLRRRARRQ